MHGIDPDTTTTTPPADTPADAAATAAAAAPPSDPAAPAEPAAPAAPVDEVGGMLDAMTAGEEGGAPAPAAPAAPAQPAEPAQPGQQPPAAPQDPQDPQQPAAATPPGAQPQQPGAPAAAAPEPDAAVEAEIAAIEKEQGKPLSEGGKNRFREMATEIRDFSPVRDALTEAGVKSVDDVKRLTKDATDGAFLIGEVTKTGCTGEDFTRMLDIMGTIAAGRKGDRAAVERAFQVIGEEYAAIAKALGREIPGVHDPLAEHVDLRDAVAAGDLPRERALEVAQARATQAAVAQRQRQEGDAAAQQRASEQLLQQGVQSLMAWEQGKLADPAYAALRPALNEEVGRIRQQYPPQQWAAMTEYAYRALAAQARPAAPAQPPKPTPGPVRPTGPRPAMAPTTDDPVEAMMQGIAAAGS